MRLTFHEMFKCSGNDRFHIENLRQRGTSAFAFGRNVMSISLTYLPIDCLVMSVCDILAQSYSRKLAAQFCLVHFDILATVLAIAEANPERPAYFSVIDTRVKGQLAHVACGTNTDDPELIAFELARTPVTARSHADRITSVNVSMLLQGIRDNAAKHHIDLSAPFLPPVGSKELADLLGPYVEVRDAAVDMVVAAGSKSRPLFCRQKCVRHRCGRGREFVARRGSRKRRHPPRRGGGGL